MRIVKMNIFQKLPTFSVALLAFWVFGLSGILDKYMFKPTGWNWHFPSGVYNPSWQYIVIFIGVILLVVEVFKSASQNSNATQTVENLLSLVTFLGFLMTFLFQTWALNSVFAMYTVFSFVDIILGYGIGLNLAKQTIYNNR